MTKRSLSSAGGTIVKSPSVDLRTKPGTKITGVIKRIGVTKYGHYYDMVLEATDGEATIQEEVDNGKKVKKPVEVKAGDDVRYFASTFLDIELQAGAKVGDRIEIVWNGLKLNPGTGRSFNDFEASVLD